MKWLVMIVAILSLPVVALANPVLEIFEPGTTGFNQYQVISGNELKDPAGGSAKFKYAGTFSGIAKHFYGNANVKTVEALIEFNDRAFEKKKYLQNSRDYWLYTGKTVLIPSQLILNLNVVGKNPTTMKLKDSISSSLHVFGRYIKRQGLQVELPTIGAILSDLDRSETTHNLKDELVHTITFGKGVQGPTRINVSLEGTSATFRLNDIFFLRAVYAKKACNNLHLQLLRKTGKISSRETMDDIKRQLEKQGTGSDEPAIEVEPVKPRPQIPGTGRTEIAKIPRRYMLMEYMPEPEQIVRMFVTSIENKINRLQTEVVTEYRLSKPWNGADAYGESIGAQASVYTDNCGNWWWGPAAMFDRWWGKVDKYSYEGDETIPGATIKYERPWWNVRTHMYVGDIREEGQNLDGYRTEKKFRDVFLWDFLISSKNIKWAIPVLEELNIAFWGRVGSGNVEYASTFLGNSITEAIRDKQSFGTRADLDFQSIDLTENGQTLTVGAGYRYDANEWDYGHGPLVTLALGQRQLNETSGDWNHQIPPHKYLKFSFGVDLERETYEYQASIFWAEGYYAYKDRKLVKLLNVLHHKKQGEQVDDIVDELIQKTLNTSGGVS